MSVRCSFHQRAKGDPVQVDQLSMVPAFEVDVGHPKQTLVDNHRNVVGVTYGRYGPTLAVREDVLGLSLGSKLEVSMNQLLKPAEANLTGGRQIRDDVTPLVFEQD